MGAGYVKADREREKERKRERKHRLGLLVSPNRCGRAGSWGSNEREKGEEREREALGQEFVTKCRVGNIDMCPHLRACSSIGDDAKSKIKIVTVIGARNAARGQSTQVSQRGQKKEVGKRREREKESKMLTALKVR